MTSGLFNACKYHRISVGSGTFGLLEAIGFEERNSFPGETQSQ